MKKIITNALILLLVMILLVGCADDSLRTPSLIGNASCSTYEEYMAFLNNRKLPDTFISYESIAMIGDFYAFVNASDQFDNYYYLLTDQTGKQITFGIMEEWRWSGNIPSQPQTKLGGIRYLQDTQATVYDAYIEKNGIYYGYTDGVLSKIYWKHLSYCMYLLIPTDYPGDASDTFVVGLFRTHPQAEEALAQINAALPVQPPTDAPFVTSAGIHCENKTQYGVFLAENQNAPYYFLTHEQISSLGDFKTLVIYTSTPSEHFTNADFKHYTYALTDQAAKKSFEFSVKYYGEALLPSGTLPPTDVKPLPEGHITDQSNIYFTFGLPEEDGVIEENGVRYYYNTSGRLYKIEWSYRGISLSVHGFSQPSATFSSSFIELLLHSYDATKDLLDTFNKLVLAPVCPVE